MPSDHRRTPADAGGHRFLRRCPPLTGAQSICYKQADTADTSFGKIRITNPSRKDFPETDVRRRPPSAPRVLKA